MCIYKLSTCHSLSLAAVEALSIDKESEDEEIRQEIERVIKEHSSCGECPHGFSNSSYDPHICYGERVCPNLCCVFLYINVCMAAGGASENLLCMYIHVRTGGEKLVPYHTVLS